MKLFCASLLFLIVSSTNTATTRAFVIGASPRKSKSIHPIRLFSSPDDNRNDENKWKSLVTGTIVGLTLATAQVASAIDFPSLSPPTMAASSLDSSTTVVIAAGAYQPESGYDSLDMSMPSYKIEDTASATPSISELSVGVGGVLDGTGTPKADPAKEAERQVKLASKVAGKEAQETAKAKAYYEKQQAKAANKAESENIKAKVDADRKAKAEAKLAEQEARMK
jgi:hypothetical protein